MPGPLPNPPGPNPPIETDPEAIFDGSPTLLSAQFQRDTTDASSFMLASSTTTETAYVHIRKGDVYSVSRAIDIPPGENFTLDLELPAEKGYIISAITVKDGRFLEIGSLDRINAPAKKMTDIAIPLVAPQYTLYHPNEMYSGGYVNEFTVSLGSARTHAYIYLGLNPWFVNGTDGLWASNPDGFNPTGWIVGHMGGQLPVVTEPTKLFYQVGIGPNRDLVPDQNNWPYHYVPNLDDGEPLPHIWIYPHPYYPDRKD